MKLDDFNYIVDQQLEKCHEILVDKAGDYAEADDRLSQFKIAAALEGCTSRQAVAGMMAKHTQSVFELCKRDELASMEKWDEKITDHINYLLLLRAVVAEETVQSNPDSTSVRRVN